MREIYFLQETPTVQQASAAIELKMNFNVLQ